MQLSCKLNVLIIKFIFKLETNDEVINETKVYRYFT